MTARSTNEGRARLLAEIEAAERAEGARSPAPAAPASTAPPAPARTRDDIEREAMDTAKAWEGRKHDQRFFNLMREIERAEAAEAAGQ